MNRLTLGMAGLVVAPPRANFGDYMRGGALGLTPACRRTLV